ncbi:MAG TPA: AMP-binding protein [Pseudonocardia sp.]|jgi:acyl-CoA synthetase (AMP-forming)/AMP-acid ligase II
MPGSLRDLILARREADPEGGYLRHAREDRTLGNRDLAEAAARWADTLHRLGLPLGARVMIDVADPLAFAACYLSVIAAGRCAAPVDPHAPDAARRRARDILRPALVVGDRPGRAELAVDPRTGLPRPAAASPATAAGNAPPGPPGTGPGGGAAALLTSGSTGRPKTVLLDEARLLHVARAVARHNRLTPDDRGFNPLPLFHVNAQVVGLLATLVAGGSVVLDDRFHRTGFWPLLAAHDVTWLNGAPAILAILARDPVDRRPARLRFVRSASAALPRSVRDAVRAGTGVPVVESYGMTEAASQITATPLEAAHRPGSVGPPVEVELRVVGEDGRDLPPGVVGRVRIRGAGVIRGYADGGAAGTVDLDGWLDTADLGHRDADGYLYLAGRADDVVNRGGELVYPREVEEVLLADPEVAEAVVVGRPDDVLGSVPVACVRMPEDAPDDRAAAGLVERLTARCAAELARYKRPVEIRVVTGFPLGPTGKVRRAELRRRLAEDPAVAR